MSELESVDFFKTGGALEPDDPSYVTRLADQELWQAVLSGQYCNILTSRQMGKSSLMVRTVSRLRSHGVCPVVIDLTNIGTTVTVSEWYFGIVSQFKRQLGLNLDEVAWWTERADLGPVQRFSDFLRQVVLEEVNGAIVVFIDEIDSTLNLSFTDDFFAAIRALYNARAREPIYQRLTFVLVGVARPTELIRSRWRTPYNIGTSIDLGDFSEPEAQKLLKGLKDVYPQQAETILEQVLYWTDGHPYLTQKVCAEVAAGDECGLDEGMDRLVERLFLAPKVKREESNLVSIRDRIRESRDRAAMLRVYRRIRAGEPIKDEERAATKSHLKLIGLVKVGSEGCLVVRNRIYHQIFDTQWVKETMPITMAQRIAMVTTALAVLAVLIVGYFYYQELTRPDSVRAELFISNFLNTKNPEVRLNNLAGLFKLNGYQDQARDLFFELSTSDQLTMFVGLPNPQQVGADILTITEGVYQDERLENNEANNELLRRIAEVLAQMQEDNPPGAQVRGAEIQYWMEGRKKAAQDDFDQAIKQYGLALALNDELNPAILVDRALAQGAIGEYEQALHDLKAVVDLDESRAEQVKGVIEANDELYTYVGEHRQEVVRIAGWFPTLTPTTAPTLKPIPIPTPTNTLAPSPSATRPSPTPLPPSPTFTSTPTPTLTLTPSPVAPGVFNSFETRTDWQRGDEPNGTFESQSSAQVRQGAYAGQLDYEFSSSGNDYVVFMWSHQLSGQVNNITAWVYGDGAGHYLNLWVKDAEGETWQFTFGKIEHSGWQRMTAYLDPTEAWPVTHIDGPDNGVLDYPISFTGLVLDDVPDGYVGNGTIYIDDLTSGRETRPPTPTSIPNTINFRADSTVLFPGQCTQLRWDVENVREVYLNGAPVVGHGQRTECPDFGAAYTLFVVLNDGTYTTRIVTIEVR